MPEIAEVETVRNVLKKKILHKRIEKVKVLYAPIIESNLKEFETILIGKEFVDILRKGKWLIFDLDDYYLISHLRMEGKYFIKDSNDSIVKHEHIIFTLNDGNDLRYHDTRKFGKMRLLKKEEINDCVEIQKQGYEPGDRDLTVAYLLEKFKGKKLPIKTTLLDQTIISGLGNIYVDEVLFESGINPLKETSLINEEEAKKIISTSKSIIEKAILNGGTTIRSYTSSLGVTGSYQKYLKVHQRLNEKCYNCGSIINKISVNGRGTYYCPKCQK